MLQAFRRVATDPAYSRNSDGYRYEKHVNGRGCDASTRRLR